MIALSQPSCHNRLKSLNSFSVGLLAGLHLGCFEVFGNDRVRALRDLKGKSVGVRALGTSPHLFLAAMAQYVGVDPRRDINWITDAASHPKALFEQGLDFARLRVSDADIEFVHVAAQTSEVKLISGFAQPLRRRSGAFRIKPSR